MTATTHCPNGHLYTARSTRWIDGRYRQCRICVAASNERLKERRKKRIAEEAKK